MALHCKHWSQKTQWPWEASVDEAELTGMPPSASAIGDLVCETEIIGGSLVLTARLSSVFFYCLHPRPTLGFLLSRLTAGLRGER